MNPKEQRSLFESVNSIMFPSTETTEKETEETISENTQEELVSMFLGECLGSSLNESSDEDLEKKIYESVYGLNILTQVVNEYFGFTEESSS